MICYKLGEEFDSRAQMALLCDQGHFSVEKRLPYSRLTSNEFFL